MMLPILISVSLAPSSYFFCAHALPVEANATAPVASAAINSLFESIVFSLHLTFDEADDEKQDGVNLDAANELLGDHGDLPGAVRHQEDDEKQDDAEHRAGKAFRDALRNIRHEDDEGRADDRPGQPANAADHHAEEQRDRERNGVAVRRHELHDDRPEPAGDA